MVRAASRVFFAVWFLAFAGPAVFAGNRVALVIGNSDYALAPLENPKNDADDVAAVLKRLQFIVTTRKNLTVREFDQVIDSFEATAKDAEVALFFFSGHGVQIDKRGYLAPVDIKAESESSALRELVAIQEIVSRIENAARVSVIVLDACRDSPLQERLRRVAIEKNRAILPPKGLPPVSVVGSNTLIVYATSPGETASDGSSRNSPFTASLLKNIETPGLEIELMFKRVTRDVLNETHGKQQPERLSRLQNEVMLAPSSTEGRPQPALSDAAQNWSRIKDLQDPKIFEDFLDRYGSANPDYGALASRRIEELRRLQTAFTVPPKLSSAPQEGGTSFTGAGATFPYPIYANWAEAYRRQSGSALTYLSIGSGAGLKQIAAKTVAFGATDLPLAATDLAAGDLIQWPMVLSAIVPVVNLEGIDASGIIIDGPALAKIFLGVIKTWDDPALKKLNPSAKLPSGAITVIHRSDASGTTLTFTHYLSKVSPEWQSKAGPGASVTWPCGVAGKGNEGVATLIQNTKNSIGYVDAAYAKQSRLTAVKMLNKAGVVVEANSKTVQAAAASADWDHSDASNVLDQPGANAWPIAAATFIVMQKKPNDPAASREALRFFAFGLAQGDTMAEELAYVPLPANAKKWAEITLERY